MTAVIKMSNLYKYFFYLFIFFIPFQTRKIFFTDYSFYSGAYTEFGTLSLYLTDILLLLSLLSFAAWNRPDFKTYLLDLKNDGLKRSIVFLLAILCGWFFLSTILNRNYQILELFRSFKMLELAILSIYVSIIFRNHRFFISSLYTLIITAIMQSFIAFYQYYYQHSLFISPYLHNITGESILAPAAPGIAKIVINGEKIVRAYGTFPHPNILGGFLLFSFLLSIYIYARHKSRLMSNFSYPLFFYLYRLLWTLVFFLQLLALYLSFSRSAWLGFLISLFFVLLLILKNRIVSRETILPIKLFLMQYRAFAFAICTFLLLFINSVSLFNYRIFQDTAYPQDAPSHAILQNKTFSDRLFYNNVSRETITHQPLIGSGPGTAIFQINRYLINTFKNTAIESWGYQPTHNIYLLAASEVGLLGCIIFIMLISLILIRCYHRIVSRETINPSKSINIITLSIVIGFLSIGCFDHYLWTIQQGQLIFWFSIGILLI